MSMAPSASPRSAGHILLVEDDAEISRMLRQVLAVNGFTTTCVMSPTDMEPVLARGNVDLMVLDVMLPGEDGFSICRRLRATSGIPIIMLTALGEDVNRIVGLEIGADDYVTKPFNSRELVARIRALLRSRYDTTRSRSPSRPSRLAGWRSVDRESTRPQTSH